MRLFGYILVNIKNRVREEYTKGGNEAAYATYRALTGEGINQSWRAVKPWIKEWRGK